MPTSSYADLLPAWERLAKAAGGDPAALAGFEPLAHDLRTLLAEVRFHAENHDRVNNPKEIIMSRSRADVVLEWEKLGAAFRANPSVLIALEPVLQELDGLLAEVRTLGVQQDAQQAAVQQTTREIEERVKRGTLLASRLRNGAKAFYGTRTEKVIEFGIRPFRKPVRAPKVIVQAAPEAPRNEAAPGPAKPTS